MTARVGENKTVKVHAREAVDFTVTTVSREVSLEVVSRVRVHERP